MIAAYKDTTLYSNNGYAYPLVSYFEERDTDPSNVSTIYCEAQLKTTNGYWSSSYNSTLSIYWHDNKDFTDVLVNSINFSSIPAGGIQKVSGTINVQHKSDGTLSGYAKAVFTKGGTSAYTPNSGNVVTDLTALTSISLVKLNSFTGTNINGVFKANYTPISGQGYTYKLRISIPNATTLQRYDNYSSNQEVTLSSDAKQTIKSYTTSGTINLGGVIEVYNGGTKISESSEITISVSTKGNSARLRINGQWKEAKPYIRINGQWKEAKPYIRVNNQWKEGI
jgi:hypothetical protein